MAWELYGLTEKEIGIVEGPRVEAAPGVTPAQAGVQAAWFWIPAFAGMTGAGQCRPLLPFLPPYPRGRQMAVFCDKIYR